MLDKIDVCVEQLQNGIDAPTIAVTPNSPRAEIGGELMKMLHFICEAATRKLSHQEPARLMSYPRITTYEDNQFSEKALRLLVLADADRLPGLSPEYIKRANDLRLSYEVLRVYAQVDHHPSGPINLANHVNLIDEVITDAKRIQSVALAYKEQESGADLDVIIENFRLNESWPQ